MIIDFLKTKRTPEELKIALEVLREFKNCESEEEWCWTSFTNWRKLEQLEEYLEHLVEGKPLRKELDASNIQSPGLPD